VAPAKPAASSAAPANAPSQGLFASIGAFFKKLLG
jgi:hypothetical protein